ncbi:hypothetical protein B7463_g6646, partial [Scytalidium lignicola]
MPRIQEFQLHPFGWENDPEEERFKLSTIDYLTTTTYLPMAIFFRLEEAEKPKTAAILKEGIERTLSQIRHFCGTIERDDDGHHSIVKRKSSTVKFVIQYLDSPEDKFPSFSEIAEAHFVSSILGDIDVLCNAPMTCGSKPEAHPDNRPAISSFKANFVPGGLILIIHGHHYSNGITGFNFLVEQLAGNCYAIAHATEFPSFDMRCLDRSVLSFLEHDRPSNSKESQVDAPPRPGANMQHRQSQSLMFHLRKSRAAELKKAASSSDGSWISTYDAVCAMIWRILSRIREPLYKPGLDYRLLWATGVSIHKLFTNPPLPAGFQGNSQVDIKSTMSTIPQLTLAEVISEAPLSKIASYTRQLTDSVTADLVAAMLQEHAHVRNKHDLSINLASFPPMSILVSDWRIAHLCKFDFGFGELSGWRHLFGGVPPCQVLVYAPHKGPAGNDEGIELQITFETELAPQLINDPEWSKYFEFRGVDASDGESMSIQKSKL